MPTALLQYIPCVLVQRVAVGFVELPEDVQLVEAGEGDEEDVPEHQHGAVLAVQFPAVGVRCHHQEDDRGEQRQGGVDQTWIRLSLNNIDILKHILFDTGTKYFRQHSINICFACKI
jgi:hypothetical protein